MFRVMTLAAVAATLIAAPAGAAEIHISTVGKSPAQLQDDIRHAATKLCRAESAGSVFSYYLEASCFRRAVHDADAQLDAAKVIESASR